MQAFKPATDRELARTLAEATAARTPLEIMGAGSKRVFGRPVQSAATISTASLRGIPLYEPTELVMSALSGTPLNRIEAELAAKGQMLGFEPIDLGPMLGEQAGMTTIGGVFATNLSGARRIALGAARDHLLGVKALTGTGQALVAGGRVMKNVTGYDMTRLLAGSWGTLAVMTEVTFKVLPQPEDVVTLVLAGLDAEAAVEALCHAMGTPYEVSGAVHIDAALVPRLHDSEMKAAGRSLTAIRLENFTSALQRRREALARELQPYAEAHVLDRVRSLAFWGELRQLSVLQGSMRPVWRISTAPTSGPRVVALIRRYIGADAVYDWSGGLVWAEVAESADAGAADIRRVIASVGGHATLVRAAEPVRAGIDVFQPQEPALDQITRSIKAVLDPAGILNPGRMVASG